MDLGLIEVLGAFGYSDLEALRVLRVCDEWNSELGSLRSYVRILEMVRADPL